MHGLGLGLTQYRRFIQHLFVSLPDRPVLVPLLPHVSQELLHPRFLRPMGRQEMTQHLAELIAKLGWADLNDPLSDASDAEGPAAAKKRGITMLSHSKWVFSKFCYCTPNLRPSQWFLRTRVAAQDALEYDRPVLLRGPGHVLLLGGRYVPYRALPRLALILLPQICATTSSTAPARTYVPSPAVPSLVAPALTRPRAGPGPRDQVLRRHRARRRELPPAALRLVRERALVRGDPRRARPAPHRVLPRRQGLHHRRARESPSPFPFLLSPSSAQTCSRLHPSLTRARLAGAQRVRRYLASHGVRKGLRFDPGGHHGEALLSRSPFHHEILRWLREEH